MQPKEICVTDLLGARYRKQAHCEWAPEVVDCLTSIWHIFQRVRIEMPITYIGDMPRKLLSSSRFKALQIDIEDAQCSDVIFVRRKKEQKRMISHVALFLSRNQIFHCSQKGAKIQSQSEFFQEYEQTLNFKQMVRYIDSRNCDLREEHKGIYVKA